MFPQLILTCGPRTVRRNFMRMQPSYTASRLVRSLPPAIAAIAPTHPQRAAEKTSRERSDFTTNRGRVVDVLRYDLTNFFQVGSSMTPTIYQPRMCFRDARYAPLLDDTHSKELIIHGRKNYLHFLAMVRLFSHIMWRNPEMTMVQLTPTAERTLILRWSCRGMPRFHLFSSSEPKICDGVSVYKLGDDGYVVEHILQEVMPPPFALFDHLRDVFSRFREMTPATTAVGSHHLGASPST